MTDNKNIRERSVLYPYYGLKESLEFTRRIQKLAGKESIPEEILAKDMEVHIKTKSLTSGISSARQFGLIAKSKEGIQLTPRARYILNPTPEINSEELLKECVELPPLYKKLIRKYEGQKLPEEVSLSNILLHEGISEKARKRATKAFIQSLKYAKMLDNQNLLSKGISKEYPNENNKDSYEENSSEIKNKKGNHNHRVILSEGREASISIPYDITDREIGKLIKLLEVFKQS